MFKLLTPALFVCLFSMGANAQTYDPATPAAPAAAPTDADTTEAGGSQRGGFFIEPGVSYELGTVRLRADKYTGGLLGDSTGDANGFGLVGRAGFHINDMFFVAADARYSWLNHQQSINNETSDATSWTLAPTLGVQTPVAGIRVWASYIAVGQLDPAQAGDWDFRYTKPQGWLLGAGARLYNFSVNLEYKNVKFDEIDVQRTPFGFSPGATDMEGENRAWMLSVTFPFAL